MQTWLLFHFLSHQKHSKHCICITKVSPIMRHRSIIMLYSQKDTKHTNTFCGHTQSLWTPWEKYWVRPKSVEKNEMSCPWQAMNPIASTFQYIMSITGLWQPIPVAVLSKTSDCCQLLAAIAGSNPFGDMDACLLSVCVLSGRGLRDGLITRREESYKFAVPECDRKASIIRRLWLPRGCCNMGGTKWL